MAWDPFADPADAPTEPPRPPRLRLVEPKEEAEHVEAEDLQDRAVICLVGCFSHGYPYKMRGSSPTFYPGLRKKRNLPQRTPTLTEVRSACCGSPPPRPPFQELGPGSSIPSLAELEEARRFRDKLWKAKQTDQVLQAAKLKPCPELVQKRLGGCLGWRRDECV